MHWKPARCPIITRTRSAQARLEGLSLLTGDSRLAAYGRDVR